MHGKDLLLRVQIQRTGAAGVVVAVGDMRSAEGGERITLRSRGEGGAGRLLGRAMDTGLSELRLLLRGLTSARLGELKLHLRHALGGKLELSFHVLHSGRVIAVGGASTAGGGGVGERVSVLRRDIVGERDTTVVLDVLLLVELGHKFTEDVVVLFSLGVGVEFL